MTNPVHLLTVAALLLVAFLIGAVAGSLLRLLALRLGRKPMAVPAAVAEAAPDAPPLVAAPVIAPLPATPPPAPPPMAEVPVPDFAATLIALAEESPPPSFLEVVKPVEASVPGSADRSATGATAQAVGEMQPARVAGETTSGRPVPAPLPEPLEQSPPAPPSAGGRSAEVIPFPSFEPEPALADIAASAAPVIAGPVEPVTVEAAATEVPQQPVAVTIELAAMETPEAETDAAAGDATTTAPEHVSELAPISQPAQAEIAPLPEAEPAPQVEIVGLVAEPQAAPAEVTEPVVRAETPAPEAAADESVDVAVDEDAAMRAIEGNWTPRRPPVRPTPAPAPEGVNQAVAASARAVAAARRTAEAAVAEVAVEAGRPPGLDAPREGGKDDLTHIIGVLPVIETALNKLGIYHFDQLGGLTDEQIGWIEGHLGVPGRIGRELWREQARELAVAMKPKRAAES